MLLSSDVAIETTFIADEMLRLLVHAETLPFASEKYKHIGILRVCMRYDSRLNGSAQRSRSMISSSTTNSTSILVRVLLVSQWRSSDLKRLCMMAIP